MAGAGGFRVDLGRVGLAPVGCEETEFCIRLMRNLPGRRLLFEIIRRMLSRQIYDVIDTTKMAMTAAAPCSADESRQMPTMVAFSPAMARQTHELKRFLRQNLYQHPQVLATTGQAKDVMRELFGAYLASPAEMPGAAPRPGGELRRVADYIAGMTDRFALREHYRLTGRTLFSAPV